MALVNRGVTYGEQGNVELQLADYTAAVEMSDAPAEQRAMALVNRGITYGEQGNVELELADYTAAVEMPEVPADGYARALGNRAVLMWRQQNYELCVNDFSALLSLDGIEESLRTQALFALVEPLVALESREVVLSTLERAFVEGESEVDGYGGTPGDLLSLIHI